ncbi:MAG TPA: toluene tolerance protein [Porticoccaceae bacterium]|jgi:phospholipid transport system substrate-binding protein|nr:toluene tolerance protein [Porticoccaceae bacterium]
MRKMYCLVIATWMLFILAGVSETHAQDSVGQSDHVKQQPFNNIEEMTLDLLGIISNHQAKYPANQAAYFEALNRLMEGFVDFDFVAKKVMGKYYKAASKEQRVRFEREFRRGLIETYGRGLMSYGDQKIVLINKSPLKKGQKAVVVKQEIRSASAVYPLNYLMYRKKSTGEWNVVNVTLNGIDLSKTFASQFLNAARKNQGNIDQVVDNWLSGS